MSHSVQIDSFQHTKKRYAESASIAIDPLVPKRHETIVAPIFPEKRELSNEGTASLGSTVIYKFPTSGYVSHVCIKNFWAQTTTADMSNYPGFASIEQVEFVADSETLMKFYYDPVIEFWMSQLPNEEAVDKVLSAAGGVNCGSSSGTIYTIVPIPLFFDHIIAKGVAPLNLSKFKKQPELRITYRTATNCTKPTGSGASLTTSKMVLYMSETAPVLKNMHNKDDYFYKSIDFYTNVKNAIATGTETYFDVSGLKGQIKKIYLRLQTEANVDTNKVYFANQEIDLVKTDHDGDQEWVFRQKEEGELDFLFYNFANGFNSTIGYGYLIPYSYQRDVNWATNNVGGVHSSKINKHQLIVSHSIGAGCYLDVLGLRSALYIYENGNMVRKL